SRSKPFDFQRTYAHPRRRQLARCLSRLRLASSQLDRSCACLFAGLNHLRKKYDDEFYQYDIGQDYEQRRQDNRACRCATNARSATLRPHSLETRNQTNDQSEHGGLKRWWQEIVEIRAVKTGIDELM